MKEEHPWHIEIADMAQRLRYVMNNIDNLSKRHECCQQLEVVVARLDELAELTEGETV